MTQGSPRATGNCADTTAGRGRRSWGAASPAPEVPDGGPSSSPDDRADLYLLLRDLRGPVATLGRVAAGTFALFYGAAEAVSGVATATLVQHVADLPADEQATAAGVVQALWDEFLTDDLLFLVGSAAWVVAAVAVAVARRRAGAPLVVSVLLGLSAVAVFHAPPIGPVGAQSLLVN